MVSLTGVGCDASHIIAQSAANQRSQIHTRRRLSITTINELQATDREIVGHCWLQKPSSGLLQESLDRTNQPMRSLKTYCADVGSIAGGKFGWAGSSRGWEASGTSIDDLACSIARDLDADSPVALGFECPLFVPFVEDSSRLGCAREGEGARPWSAHAGAASLATGLVQVAWLLSRIKEEARQRHQAFLNWQDFGVEYRGLFLWEAFVSAKAKRESHVDDAKAAVDAFVDALPDPRSCIQCSDGAYSLVGAALLRTGWAVDVPCFLSLASSFEPSRVRSNKAMKPTPAQRRITSAGAAYCRC